MRLGSSAVTRRLTGASIALALATLLSLAAGSTASAAVSCPNSNPILQENNCAGAGTTNYRLSNQSDNIAGFATKSSFDKGESVPLKIARNAPVIPATKVDITVYRTGYYGGAGARLIPGAGASGVTVNNSQACNPMDTTTGRYDCGNWNVTYTIPGASLPTSGVYLAKLRTTDTGIDNWVTFVVRDDNRTPESKLLFVVPTATYQAYNTWGGKSLYFDRLGQGDTVSGDQRAVKVSFNRPYDFPESSRDRYYGPDIDLVYWYERQGYDISYTDDEQASVNAAELRQHKVVAIGAHSEYWSGEEMANLKAARDAGTSILSLGANTGYWKVRYENGGRTLVCYKTVQGGNNGSGALGANDWGPDGLKGTADDAVGADGRAGTADDNPQNSTTTFRDNGAPQGDINAPPEGRVGPNLPENSLLGNMYVGDDDDGRRPLTVPAANANGEYSGDRIWRNAGLAQNVATTIGTDVVGWEWDAVPTQAQYLAFQPSGVKRVSLSTTTDGTPSWLQDEGRARATTPPAGQPGAVSAVKYKAASGAWVFGAGTNWWANGLGDTRISQATYNMISDMGVQPLSPASDLTLDGAGSNQPPTASFTVTPSTNPVPLNQAIQFNASSSTDSDGTITKYEWDLDGNGTFETNTGTVKTASKTYTAEGSYDVRLRVTDNGAATDLAVKTVEVLGNRPPTASFTVTPNPAVTSQTVSFDGAGSSDPDGTIAKYEWDLDGNGTYETNTGATKTTTKVYSATGTYTLGLRVTDNGGKTATATVPLTVNSGGVSNYGDAVLDTPGLKSFWRMGEASGTVFADSKGASPATMAGGVTLGVPGGPLADPNTAASFDGADDAARASLNLSSTSQLTVEFWMKWDQWASDDKLAMEFTPNFNNSPGGFLIDPNAPQGNGSFGIALGNGGGRNNAYIARPTAAAWHHYAFVMDTTAPAASQITPYVDGQLVAYTKGESGTGAGAFANAALNFMSRDGSALFGAGDLDEVAIYDRTLSAATIKGHYDSYGANRRPVARFTTTPNPAAVGQTVTFNGSTSSDPDGSITKYQWDLDGNGSYETDTGSNPQTTKSYASEADIDVGLKVTDNQFGIDTETKTLKVGDQAPTASFTADPNPSVVGQSVRFDGSASTDDGTIARYEWDLDGNGTFETDTGTTKTASKAYTSTGTVQVKLRVTDAGGKTGTATLPVTINSGGVSNYGDTVLDTAGLRNYWRMGESTGTAFADSKGTSPAATAGGVTLGVPGGVSGDPNTAARFDGVDDRAQASLDLSNTSQVTLEFWLKWSAYANDDRLAMEFSPNFNNAPGGILVDPNAPQNNGTFAVGIGDGPSRNTAYFARPSAGQWHHYALVLDSAAPGDTQVTPYVDGRAVSYTKGANGTGGGKFLNSTLYMMSRGGSALFGAGDLDEVAVYDRALDAGTIDEHFNSSGTNRRPKAAFTISPNPAKTGQTVTFNAASSTDPDGTIRKYQWDLDGDGTYETDTGTTTQATRSYATNQDVTVKLRVTDDLGGTDTETHDLSVGNRAPTAALTVTPSMATVGQSVSFDATGSADIDGTITKYEWDLDGNGSYETDTGTTKTTTKAYAAAATLTIGLRVTDSDGATATASKPLTVKTASYAGSVLATTGLLNYWRMGEASGTSLADSKGANAATVSGATLGVPGGVAGDSNTAVRFNGSGSFARADLNLTQTSTVTIEFWMKWNAFANDDDLAMEFTPNFNNAPGGFLVDPNSSNSSFGLGLGDGSSRNNAYFARPSAGQWHHYALVFDATAPAATQITPYVDGQAVPYTKGESGTGAGPFLNSTLYFMSRGGSALFGAGDLDELAVYDRALTPATVAAHYTAGTP